MTFRYVPVLRPKRGKRVALQNLSPTARQDVVPLFVLSPDRYVGKKATKHVPAVSPPVHFIQEIQTAWGAAPFYLDASALVHGGGQNPLVVIANGARARNLNLIPATWGGAAPQYQQAVATVVGADHRGVALRVGLQGFTTAATWIGGWQHPLNETDLIVDAGANIVSVQAIGSTILSQAFGNLHQAGAWRTVTIVGTSMPDNFQGYDGKSRTLGADWS